MNNDLLSQLKDIDGLAPISAWPLAIGWWVVLAIAITVIAGIAFYLVRKQIFENSWKGATTKTLTEMQNALGNNNTQNIAIQLSEELRRIAIKKYSRQQCAGLAGNDWLTWLSANDNNGFDWVANGKLLIEAPYAPPGKNIKKDDVDLLINATRRWVR